MVRRDHGMPLPRILRWLDPCSGGVGIGRTCAIPTASQLVTQRSELLTAVKHTRCHVITVRCSRQAAHLRLPCMFIAVQHCVDDAVRGSLPLAADLMGVMRHGREANDVTF